MKLNESHIIIGIGGTGGDILKSMRKRFFQETTADERRTIPLGFVYVDSSKENMKPNDSSWKVLGEDAQLGKDSFLYVKGASLGSLLASVDSYPGIKNWIGNRKIWEGLVGAVGDDGAAAQRRRLGRFLFSCSVNEYESILKNQVKSVCDKIKKNEVTFHIIAGLAGGTGSGSVVDIVAQTRKHFKSVVNGVQHKIIVYCLVPERSPLPDWDKGFYHANGFAALQELNALQVERFKPHDVSGQYTYIPLEKGKDVFNCCFLFTNANENGVTVDTKKELPDIVSDFIFHSLSVLGGPTEATTNEFARAYTLENVVDSGEKDENAKTLEIANTTEAVRTRKFNSFGIKRIVSPEEEIVEYVTYNFAKQSLLQFKYNNWSDDLGYRDQPKNEDYISFVTDKATLNSWLLSDAHLALSLPVLPSEKEQKWKSFLDDWNGVVPTLANLAWGKEEARAINELSKLCDERFDKSFRKVGVPEFYKIKEQARKDTAKEICDTIERDLFNQWQTGQKSIYEIERLMDTLISQTEIRLKAFDGKITSRNEDIEKMYVIKAQNEQKWGSLGPFAIALGERKKLYQIQTTHLQGLYFKKTDLEGLRFAKKLIAETLNEMQLLNNEIKCFSKMLSDALTAAEKEIGSRCGEKQLSAESFKQTVVKYYDSDDVKNFTNRVIRDQQIQSSSSSSTRNAIASLIGTEKSFNKLNENASVDSLLDIFSKKSRESAIQAHDAIITNKSQKIIGVNIIEKLKEQFGTSDKQAALNDFARNVMEMSGIFLSFDKSEISRQLKNNDPPQPGKLIMMKKTLVSIPESPENKDFVLKLIDAFKQNAEGSTNISIDNKSPRKNEITVVNLTSCFSLRMVNDVRILKEKYDLQINGNNPEVAKLVLHLEGDGTQYPDIYSEPDVPGSIKWIKRIKETFPYILLSHTLGIIKYQDKMDGTGKKAFCIAKEDEDGIPLPAIVLGDKYTHIIDSGKLDADLCAELKEGVQAKLADDYLHVTKREELEAALTNELKTIILPECKNNPSDPVFTKFREAKKEASQILKD